MPTNYHVHQFHMDCNYMVGKDAEVAPPPPVRTRASRTTRDATVSGARARAVGVGTRVATRTPHMVGHF